MILHYGTPTKLKELKGKDWHYIELRSDKTVENTLRRVGKAIPAIFRAEVIEIFIPVLHRDLDVFELETSVYVFVRSTSFPCLLRLKSVTGVVSLVTEGDSNRPSHAIKVEDTFVQAVAQKVEKHFYERSQGIKERSFVRILDGETRDYCGTVATINNGRACVKVDLKTKSMLIETPVRNLLNLSHVPDNQRVFYHSPLIAKLAEEKKLDLIKEDLRFVEDATLGKSLPEIELEDVPQPTKFSRQKTPTALVKRLVTEGTLEPLTIAKEVLRAIKKKDIKEPKNLLIVYCIIKDTLMKYHFMKLDPNLSNYRDVVTKFGKKYKFSVHEIAKIDPEIKIPISTVDPAKDGRSREARLKKRKVKEAEQREQAAIAAAAATLALQSSAKKRKIVKKSKKVKE